MIGSQNIQFFTDYFKKSGYIDLRGNLGEREHMHQGIPDIKKRADT